MQDFILQEHDFSDRFESLSLAASNNIQASALSIEDKIVSKIHIT